MDYKIVCLLVENLKVCVLLPKSVFGTRRFYVVVEAYKVTNSSVLKRGTQVALVLWLHWL